VRLGHAFYRERIFLRNRFLKLTRIVRFPQAFVIERDFLRSNHIVAHTVEKWIPNGAISLKSTG